MDRQPDGCKKKKLEDAARYWVGGGESYKDAIADLVALNAPEEAIAQLEELQRGEDFEVWPENWPFVEMFLRLQTQWRSSFGGFVGLDYNAVRWLFEIYSIEDHKEMLEALMVLERAALVAMNERSK